MIHKLAPLCAIVFVLPAAAASAAPATVPVEKYAKAIIGKWEIRNTIYEFKKNGTYGMGAVLESNVQETGRWRISDKTLTLIDTEGQSVNVGIAFSSKDRWEWESKPGRIWDAKRMK